jgi:hypothetical protein
VAAITSVFAGQFGESAGQRVRSLQENILAFNKENADLRGRGLIESVELLAQDPELRDQFIGSNKELATAVNAAINSLRDFTLDGKQVAGIRSVDAAIERAQQANVRVLEEKILEATDSTTVSGRIEIARQKRISSEAALEKARELQLSGAASEGAAAAADVRRESLERGDNVLERYGVATGTSVVSTFTDDPDLIRTGGQWGNSTLFGAIGGLREAWSAESKAEAQLERMNQRYEEMLRKQDMSNQQGRDQLNELKGLNNKLNATEGV